MWQAVEQYAAGYMSDQVWAVSKQHRNAAAWLNRSIKGASYGAKGQGRDCMTTAEQYEARKGGTDRLREAKQN
jgi:hypothetical protein